MRRGTRSGSDAVAITNADKVWWPDEGLTKLDVARHYDRVGPRLLPWTVDRPLTVERCPDGFVGRCFYQKNFANAATYQIRTHPIHAASANRTVHRAPRAVAIDEMSAARSASTSCTAPKA